LRESATVFKEDLRREPYASVLCYPRSCEAELESRIAELRELSVDAVEFSGKGNAFNVPVLGKGYVGVVVVALVGGQRLALKIRRVDADRPSLGHEAEMLAKANSVQVGPRLFGHSGNFILMQLIEGDLLPVWLGSYVEREVVRGVLDDILVQCWRLDTAGLDHGELSKAPKHLIVDEVGQPWIFDFETASDNRKPANVTAVCQYLFMGKGPVAMAVANSLGQRNRADVINALRQYKKSMARENFDLVRQISLG